jgi:hypothetical protein
VPARIVTVAGQQPLDFDDLMGDKASDGVPARHAGPAHVHRRPRRQLGGRGVMVNAVHPATFMDPSMVRTAGGAPARTVEQGGAAMLGLSTAPELEGVTGGYFDGLRPVRAHDQAYDPDAWARLRRRTEDLIGSVFMPG